MSIDSLGLGQLFGQVSSTTKAPSLGAVGAQPETAAEKAAAKAEASKAAQQAVLAQIKEKGIYAWAQEQKLEKLKEQIRSQVMSERGMDDASLSSMDPAARDSAVNSIEEEIARRIKDAMQDALENEATKAKNEGRPQGPMIIDISV